MELAQRRKLFIGLYPCISLMPVHFYDFNASTLTYFTVMFPTPCLTAFTSAIISQPRLRCGWYVWEMQGGAVNADATELASTIVVGEEPLNLNCEVAELPHVT